MIAGKTIGINHSFDVHFTNDGREYSFKTTELSVLRDDLTEICRLIEEEMRKESLGKERLQ